MLAARQKEEGAAPDPTAATESALAARLRCGGCHMSRDVVADVTLSLSEKRAILASWASDAAAVASNPALRELAGPRRIVTIDEVLEALSMLDDKPSGPPGGKPMRQKSTSRVALAA